MIKARKMWVGDDSKKYSYKCYVIAECNNWYVAVTKKSEGDFLNGKLFSTKVWKYAKPVKLTAVVKSAEEITDIQGAVNFDIGISDSSGVKLVRYLLEMNQLAGKRIEIEPANDAKYDYMGAGHIWHKSWLKDFEEE